MKIIKILISVIFIFSYSFGAFAEEKQDCSKIDTSTGVGMLEKYKCKKGMESGEKGAFGQKLKNFLKHGLKKTEKTE